MKNHKVLSMVNIGLLLVSLMVIVVSGIVTVSGQTDNEDLLQYDYPHGGGGPQFTHFSEGPAPNSPDVLWKKAIPGIGREPLAFNGKVFVTQRNNIVAMDPFTGNIVYNITAPTIPGRTRSSLSRGLWKMDDTHMVTITSSGATQTTKGAWAMVCFNIDDGSLVWMQETQYSPCGARPNAIPEEKMVLISGSNSTGRGGTQNEDSIMAWDLSDISKPPTLMWRYIGDGETTRGIYGDGKVFKYGGLFNVEAIDVRTGNVIWTTELTGQARYQATYYEGMLLAGCLDNTFVALDGNTGDVLWTFNPGTYGFWCSGSSAGYGMAYMTNVDGYLYALDVTNGEVVWKYWGGGHYYPGYVTIADGKVYACTAQARPSPTTPETSHSEYSCLDAYTGKVLWQLPIEFGAGPRDNTMVAYGNFYGIESGELICFGPPKDWNMFLGDPAHTATGYGAPTKSALKWKFTTGGAVTSSAAVVNGKVYVGSHDKKLYCLDARTGNKIWDFPTGSRILSSPAAINGKVYTGADDGWIYCLDADTGQQLWKVAAPGEKLPIMTGTTAIFYGSPTVADGKVYVGALDGKLYCLNSESGDIIWTRQTSAAILSTPTYIAGDGLYCASRDGFVFKLNPNNGNVIWNQSTPIGFEYAMMGSPAVGDGMVFIGSGAARGSPAGTGQFYCLDSATGEFKWTKDQLPGSGNLQPIWSMLYMDGKVYTADFFNLDCLDATTGDTIWTSFLTREHYGSPAYSNGKFYVGSESFGVYVVNATSGDKMEFIHSNAVWSSPAIWESKLYIGSQDWNVYCFEESTIGTPSEPEDPTGTEPTYPSAEEIAQKVLDNLPPSPSAKDIAQEIMSQLPTYPEAPEYTTIDLVILVAVVISISMGIISFWALRKQK